LFNPPGSEWKPLVVVRTDGRNIHLTEIARPMLFGAHVTVHPLLILAVNQVERFSSRNEVQG
jgi:hypothetical protein